MEPKRQIAERATALLKQISANDLGAVSGGGADTPAPPISTDAAAPSISNEELAATIVAAYESIVQGTSELIERVLGPYNAEP